MSIHLVTMSAIYYNIMTWESPPAVRTLHALDPGHALDSGNYAN